MQKAITDEQIHGQCRLNLLQSRNFRNRESCFLICAHIIQDLWEKVISQENALSMNAQTPRFVVCLYLILNVY
jgi:hypothetical protein